MQKFAVSDSGDNRIHVVDTNQPKGRIFTSLCGFTPRRKWRSWSSVSTKYRMCMDCLSNQDCEIVGDVANIPDQKRKELR